MRLLHLHSVLSIRRLVPLALACLLLAAGAGVACAQSQGAQVERAWNNLRNKACSNAEAAETTTRAARTLQDNMGKTLRKVDDAEDIPEDVSRDIKRKMRQAEREMGDVSRSAGDITRTMARICSEDIVIHNIRDAVRKYEERCDDINAAATRYQNLRGDFTRAIKMFNEALTDLAVHGSVLPQLDTTQ